MVDEKLLVEYQKSNGEKISIYYVCPGATSEDNIQVRKSNRDNPIWASEKYNYLKGSKLINDTSLQLVLADSGFGYINNRFDTIIVNTK